jgi:hypothetical protein
MNSNIVCVVCNDTKRMYITAKIYRECTECPIIKKRRIECVTAKKEMSGKKRTAISCQACDIAKGVCGVCE